MIHALKTEPGFFADVMSGKKPFEVREDDRDFRVGDFLALNEYEDPEHTGRCALVRVQYILRDGRFCKAGYATLGIEPCLIRWPGLRFDHERDFGCLGWPVYERTDE